jgi:hypothetical protein
VLAEHCISPLPGDASLLGSDPSLPNLEKDGSPMGFASLEPTNADVEQAQDCMAMSARAWMHDSGANVNIAMDNHIMWCADDFIWHQGMTHGGADQGMLTCPSDEDTVTLETNSSGLEELDGTQGRLRSICKVTATDPDDFNEKHLGTVKFVGEHPFEDYDEWFHGEEEECDTDTDHDDSDFCHVD